MALALPLIGCGGSDPSLMGGQDGGTTGDGGTNLALFEPCTDNAQCATGLCTQISYDRSPTPICTYKCDAANMNAMCPMGCNAKGYCKKPM
ncbi:MAG: hypothetical protein JWN44_6630 [Myxococcales bacterium]|nr:hypothetical protein [Myxococcales bacterium]